ncbi:unnamed protein product [Closterium sp. NIES-53]
MRSLRTPQDSTSNVRQRRGGVARVAGVVEGAAGVVVGAAVEVVKAAEVVAAVGVVVGVGALVAAVEEAVGVAVVAAVGVVEVGLEILMERGASGGIVRCPYVIRTGDRAGQTCGRPHTQHRCFSHLDDTCCAEFGDEVERPHWAELLRSGVAIFDLDYDAILFAMYALSASAEGDCYWCVPPDPGIEATALCVGESSLLGTALAQALHTQVPHTISFVTAPPSLLYLHLSQSGWLTPLGAQSLPVPPLSFLVRRFCPAHFQVFTSPRSLQAWVESVHTRYRASSGTSVCPGVYVSAVAVGAARGYPRTPLFEGCPPSPLAPSYAFAAAVDVPGAEDIGAASASAKCRSGKGKGGRGGGGGNGGGGGGSSGGGGGSGGGGSGGSGGSGSGGTGGDRTGAQRGGSGCGQRQQQQRRSEAQTPQQLSEWLFQRGASGGSGSCPYVIRTGDCAGKTCGRFHTQHRCFSRLDDAWCAEFGDEVERPRWAELLRSGVAIFDLDFDATLTAMYALCVSAEGDCYQCVPLDPVPMTPNPDNHVPRAQEFTEILQAARIRATDAIKKANIIAKRNADCHRRPVTYQPDDLVLLDTQNLRLPITPKLRPRYCGPFRISHMITPVTAHLLLPADWYVGPSFHVSLLRPYVPSMSHLPCNHPASMTRPPTEPIITPEEILSYRVRDPRGARRIESLICWKDCTPTEDNWVPLDRIENHPVLTEYLRSRNFRDVNALS